jgi:hypothetical protein
MRLQIALLGVLGLLMACSPPMDSTDELYNVENEISIPPSAVPGTMQAEDFRVGTEGTTWHDSTPTKNLGGAYRPRSGVDITANSGGYFISDIEPGEWLEYEVTVAEAGSFAVSARVASGVAGTKGLTLSVDGTKTGQASFSTAAGWQAFESTSVGSVTLTEGKHVLTVTLTTGDFNLDALVFAKASVPSLPSGTLTGSSVNGALFTTLGRSKVPVTRAYLTQLPAGSSWNDFADIRDASKYSSNTVWISFKEENPALVDAFLATKPKDLNLRVIATYFHEPEDNVTSDAAKKEYRATWQKMAPIIRKHGMTPALILMKYTLENSSGRNWRDFYPEGAVDLLGWDAYRKNDAGNLDVSNLVDPILAVSQATGLPWGIGETGSTSVRYTDADTARWAAALRAYATQKGAKVMCWWDQDTFKLDAATAKAWLD